MTAGGRIERHRSRHVVRGVFVLVCLWVSTLSAVADEAATYAADGWVARCDATACRASLASDSREEALLIARWPNQAEATGIAVGIATPHGIADRDRSIDIRVDDKSVATLRAGRDYAALEHVETFWLTDVHATEAVLAAITKGKHLRISFLDMVGAPHDADFATEALPKVVAFFDDHQHVAPAQVTAAVPPQTVARAPRMSRIDIIIRMGLPDRLLTRHLRASDCEEPTSSRLKSIPPVIGALSRVAILYAIPCTTSAAEVAYKLWVIETGEIGGITPLTFALYDPTFGWKGSELLYNVTFESEHATLTSHRPPSGASDCGHHAVWHWKDYAFALDTFELAKPCAGARSRPIYPLK